MSLVKSPRVTLQERLRSSTGLISDAGTPGTIFPVSRLRAAERRIMKSSERYLRPHDCQAMVDEGASDCRGAGGGEPTSGCVTHARRCWRTGRRLWSPTRAVAHGLRLRAEPNMCAAMNLGCEPFIPPRRQNHGKEAPSVRGGPLPN